MQTLHFPHRRLTPGLLLASALALGGCVVAPAYDHRYEYEETVYGPMESGTVWVQTAPPPMRVEYPGYAPAAGYVWISGYWNWGGVQYLWVPGRWVAPRPGYVWVPHRWDRDGDRWRHDGGRWEPERRGKSYGERDQNRYQDRYREPDRRGLTQPTPVPAPVYRPVQPSSGYVRSQVVPVEPSPQERRDAPTRHAPWPGLRAQEPEAAREQRERPVEIPSERGDRGLRAIEKQNNANRPTQQRRDEEDWRRGKDKDRGDN